MRLKTIRRFYLIEGEEPAMRRPPVRPDVDPYEELESDIKAFVNSSPRYGLMVIAGRAGTGKSTAIKNVVKEMGASIRDLPRLTNNNAITKDDAKKNDVQMREFQALPREERKAYVENLIFHGDTPDIAEEYQNIIQQLKTENDPEQLKILKTQRDKIFEKAKPRSNLSRLQEMGNSPPAYNRELFYAGSQNLDKSQLYFELYRANGGVIIYDDSNISFWDDKLLQDLLLHAAQTEKEKEISMPGMAEGYLRTQKGNLFPTKFKYTGKIVIITNRQIKELPANIQTRAFKHQFNPPSAQVLKKTGENIEALKQEFDEYPPEYVDDVYNWLMTTSGVKYDFRLFAHLLFLRDKYQDQEDFSRRAKKMIREFYTAEKDTSKTIRRSRINSAIRNYEIARRIKLTPQQRKRVLRYLKAISDKELASPDLNDLLDLETGYEKTQKPVSVYSAN